MQIFELISFMFGWTTREKEAVPRQRRRRLASRFLRSGLLFPSMRSLFEEKWETESESFGEGIRSVCGSGSLSLYVMCVRKMSSAAVVGHLFRCIIIIFDLFLFFSLLAPLPSHELSCVSCGSRSPGPGTPGLLEGGKHTHTHTHTHR